MYIRGFFVVYKECVRSVLMYGAETWAMKSGVFQRLRATERRMLRMICRVTLKDMVECHNPFGLGVYNGYNKIKYEIIVRATTILL